MQFQADILGAPVVRPKVTESTALGAAYLAGLAAGYWNGRGEIATQVAVDRRFEPSMPADEASGLRERWNSALERAKAWEEPNA
jgi:glycerol kinase